MVVFEKDSSLDKRVHDGSLTLFEPNKEILDVGSGLNNIQDTLIGHAKKKWKHLVRGGQIGHLLGDVLNGIRKSNWSAHREENELIEDSFSQKKAKPINEMLIDSPNTISIESTMKF